MCDQHRIILSHTRLLFLLGLLCTIVLSACHRHRMPDGFAPAIPSTFRPIDRKFVLVQMDSCPSDSEVLFLGDALVDASKEDLLKTSEAVQKLRSIAADVGGHGICHVEFATGGVSQGIAWGDMAATGSSTGVRSARARVYRRKSDPSNGSSEDHNEE